LVLARNQIRPFSTSLEDAGFLGTVQRLNLLTTELQASVMKTRMQPIGNVWSKFRESSATSRSLAASRFASRWKGRETELDKNDHRDDPRPAHAPRPHAVDHGTNRGRSHVAGQAARGPIDAPRLHEGGKVIIEIADDGAGIDAERVRDKAIRTKLVAPARRRSYERARTAQSHLSARIFDRRQVTQFSGRGVGMDVVRTNIERIGGTVDLESRPSRGTTVKMKIPLTLAIIPALTVTTAASDTASRR